MASVTQLRGGGSLYLQRADVGIYLHALPTLSSLPSIFTFQQIKGSASDVLVVSSVNVKRDMSVLASFMLGAYRGTRRTSRNPYEESNIRHIKVLGGSEWKKSGITPSIRSYISRAQAGAARQRS